MYNLIFFSLIITLIMFGILQYVEKDKMQKRGEEYDMVSSIFSLNSFILFFILFIMTIIILYFTIFDNKDISVAGIFGGEIENIGNKNIHIKPSNIFDPSYLKRINDPIHCGFEPYSCSDRNSSSDSGDSSEIDSSNNSSDSE